MIPVLATSGLVALALTFLPPSAADAGIRLRDLLGHAPPDSEYTRPARFDGLDSLVVARTADRGLFLYEEQVERLAGGDAARLGVEGTRRPHSLGGAGSGRLPLVLDGFPVGRGHATFGAPGWFPTRALSGFAVRSGPGAGGAGGAGRHLSADTRGGPDRPQSIVALGGGDFGHRLAELDFARRFGAVGVHADVADFGHTGFGPFGQIDGARGFIRFDFTTFGFDALLDVGLSSASVTGFDARQEIGTGDTDDAFFGLLLRRPAGSGHWELRGLRESNRLSVMTPPGDFRLTRGRWWGEAARTDSVGGGRARASLAGALETSGGLRADTDFGSVEAALGYETALGGAQLAAEARVASRQPTGWQFEPSARLSGGGEGARWWMAAARSTGIPGLLLHVDAPIPDAERTAQILERLESLDAPEAYESVVLGAGVGRRLTVGVEGSVARGTNVQPWLSAGTIDRPLGAADDERWTADARMAARWQARADLLFGVTGGVSSFDLADEPYRPRGRADGFARLRRVYFEGDLDLSGALTGTLLLPRRSPGDVEYPAVLTGGALLTAQVRALTLYFRIENMAAAYVESDLRQDGLDVPLPGWHGRIGATLRLLD